MTYADSTEVTRKVLKLETIGTIDTDILADAVATGDELVDATLIDSTVPTPVPDAIKKAATLLAAAEYVDGLAMTGDERSPTAVAWENKAYKILDGWLAENKNSKPAGRYSRNNSSINRPFYGSKTHHRRRRY